ncbi:MAG: MBL fold metallo-hydrolase RNA specificity domain-containing protein, partial [Eubacteriales bacterium]
VKYDFPVYLDSPLAVEATKIYASPDMRDYYDEETLTLLSRGINPITFDGLHVSVTTEDSKAINTDPTPKVIIASSGMCEAGRIRHHLKYNLWRKECTVLFIGYQVEGTLGRRLLDGEKTVNILGEEINVAAKIDRLDGISAHADKEGLLHWLGSMKKRPRRVYVNHGDDTACEAYAKAVGRKLLINAVAPYSGGCYDLLSDVCYDPGNMQKLQKRTALPAKNKPSVAWTKLFAAGVRLSDLIERSRGMKSKELMQLTNQINSCCNKWGKTVKNKKKKR